MAAESKLERAWKRRARAEGWYAFKWVAPGHAGVPDALFFGAGARLRIVEFKAPGQKLRRLQQVRKGELESVGFQVWVVDSMAQYEEVMGDQA